MQDKNCKLCLQATCTLRDLLGMNLNCGSRIKTEIYIDMANKCQEYKA